MVDGKSNMKIPTRRDNTKKVVEIEPPATRINGRRYFFTFVFTNIISAMSEH